MKSRFSIYFSMVSSPNRVLTPLTLNQDRKFTVGCSRVLIEVLVVCYQTAFMFTAQATTVNLPVLSG